MKKRTITRSLYQEWKGKSMDEDVEPSMKIQGPNTGTFRLRVRV